MRQAIRRLRWQYLGWQDRREARRLWRLATILRREARAWVRASDKEALQHAAALLASAAAGLEVAGN